MVTKFKYPTKNVYKYTLTYVDMIIFVTKETSKLKIFNEIEQKMKRF